MALKVLARWRGGAACLLLGALLLTVLTTENSLPADDAAKPAALPADLAQIPSDAVLVVSGRVAEVWNSYVSKSASRELVKERNEGAREFAKKFGLPLDQVERLSMAVLNDDGPPEPLFFVGTITVYDRDKVIAAAAAVKQEKYKQQTFYGKTKAWAVYPLGERTLVYGSSRALRGLIDHPKKNDGNLAAALHLAAAKHSLTCAVDVKAVQDAVGDKLPGEAETFKPLLQARYGTLTLDLGAESRAEAMLTFASEKDAKAAVASAGVGLDLARAALQRADELSKARKVMNVFVVLLRRLQESLKATRVAQEGKTLKTSVQLKLDDAAVGSLMVKAVQKVSEDTARVHAMNNLKQIGLAMQNYHDTYGNLPPQATYDKNGKPMLSWRVMILPFMEEQKLYAEFHLDESWDSEHNKRLLARMPKTYASPQEEQTVNGHTTHYQGFAGKGTIFEGKKGALLETISADDGTSHTFMVVEASKAVPWSKPEDIPYDAAKPLPKLGLPGASGFLAVFCDGSARFLAHTIKPRTLRCLITYNDGIVLGDKDF